MISTSKIIMIFCSIDDFCKEFIPFWQKNLISNRKKRLRASKMSLSEVITIQVLFHLSGYRTFKEFYLGYVSKHLQNEFPNLVSYNRMVELKRDRFMTLAVYLKTCGLYNAPELVLLILHLLESVIKEELINIKPLKISLKEGDVL